MSLIIAENGAVTLGKDRHDVCLEVAYEIEALAYVLPTVTLNDTPESYQSGCAVRGIAGRYLTLANVLLAAISDDVEKTERLAKKIYVQPLPGRI